MFLDNFRRAVKEGKVLKKFLIFFILISMTFALGFFNYVHADDISDNAYYGDSSSNDSTPSDYFDWGGAIAGMLDAASSALSSASVGAIGNMVAGPTGAVAGSVIGQANVDTVVPMITQSAGQAVGTTAGMVLGAPAAIVGGAIGSAAGNLAGKAVVAATKEPTESEKQSKAFIKKCQEKKIFGDSWLSTPMCEMLDLVNSIIQGMLNQLNSLSVLLIDRIPK
jgi:hypothetical protein